MKLRALKTTLGSYGTARKGETFDAPNWEAVELIANGYATEELPIERRPAAPQSVKLKGDKRDPFEARPDGGSIGSDKQSSSSRRGRPRRNAQ
jgi:hypothetical protein